jgi:hypothetical protein
MENKTYMQLNKIHSERIEAFPKFFAFNDEQFEEGLKKLNVTIKEIYSIEGGGFIKKTDSDKYAELWETISKENEEAMKNPSFVYEAFRYELGNHEYCITYDETDTLESLNLTSEEVDKNPMLETQLEKAKKDYLKAVEEDGEY